MGKKLRAYIAQVEGLLMQDLTEGQRRAYKDDLLVHIRFFQHERLIHLIVTAAVALLTMLSLIGALAMPDQRMYLLVPVLAVLLGFYIVHYYVLENGVQKMYELYEKL